MYYISLINFLQGHVRDSILGSEFQTYKSWCKAMMDPQRECDHAGVIGLRILTGVSYNDNLTVCTVCTGYGWGTFYFNLFS